MSFNENGFLGEQINEIMSEIYNQNKELFDYIIELNSFAQRFKFRLDVKVDNLQQIVATCAFIKFLNSFQSVFILAQRGLESDSKALLRVALEELFILKGLCDDPDFTKKYLGTDLLQRREVLKILEKDTSNKTFSKELKSSFTPEEINEISNKLDEEIKKIDAKKISIKQLAEDVGLYDFYSAYKVLCDDIHTSPRTLEKYITTDDSSGAIFLTEPTTVDVEKTLSTLIYLMFTALENLMILFGIASDEEFHKLCLIKDYLLKDVFKK